MKRSWFLALFLMTTAPNLLCSQGVFVEQIPVHQESSLDWKYAVYRDSIHDASTGRMSKILLSRSAV